MNIVALIPFSGCVIRCGRPHPDKTIRDECPNAIVRDILQEKIGLDTHYDIIFEDDVTGEVLNKMLRVPARNVAGVVVDPKGSKDPEEEEEESESAAEIRAAKRRAMSPEVEKAVREASSRKKRRS